MIMISGILAIVGLRKQQKRRYYLEYLFSLLLISAAIGVFLYAVLGGRNQNTSYLLDSILIVPVGIICCIYFTSAQRERALNICMAFLVVNALFVILQFAIKSQILPYPWVLQNGYFRPGGILGHPLLVGLTNIGAMPLIFMVRWSERRKLAVMFLLSIAIVLTSSRFSTAMLGIVTVCTIVIQTTRLVSQKKLKGTEALMMLPFVAAALGVVAAFMLSLGLLDRLIEGLFDESTNARLDVYQIFEFMTPNQFWFGMDLGVANYYLEEVLLIPGIESPIVLYIINFGAFASIFLGGGIVLFFAGVSLRGNSLVRVAYIAFFTTALTNNVLAAKGPTPLISAIMLFLCTSISLDIRRDKSQSRMSAKADVKSLRSI